MLKKEGREVGIKANKCPRFLSLPENLQMQIDLPPFLAV